MQRLGLYLLFTFTYFIGQAQCFLAPKSLEERVEESEMIVEGRIVSAEGTWDLNHHNIYTLYKIEVYRVFKGEGTIEVDLLLLGGTVGDTVHTVIPNLNVQHNDVGIFFLTACDYPVLHAEKSFKSLYMNASLIRYDPFSMIANDALKQYDNIPGYLYPELEQLCKEEHRVIRNFDTRRIISIGALSPPEIDSIKHDTLGVGNEDTLYIYGKNFGSSRGANGQIAWSVTGSPGSTYIFTNLPWFFPVWTDSFIKVIPHPLAGDGDFKIITDAGEQVISTYPIYVTNAIINTVNGQTGITRFHSADLIESDTSGGTTWVPDGVFQNSPEALFWLRRAIEEFRCETGINFKLGAAQQNLVSTDDGIFVMRYVFSSENFAGRTFIRQYWCGGATGGYVVYDTDIEFNVSVPFYYGYQPVSQANDFYKVALHELGHAAQLGHLSDRSRFMTQGAGVNRNNLRTMDSITPQGVKYVLQHSQDTICNHIPMHIVPYVDCSSRKPFTEFNYDFNSHCKEDSIRFRNVTDGYVSSYQWNFGTKAIPDTVSSKEPPVIHFTDTGVHTVQLVANNSYGSDTFYRNVYIERDTIEPPYFSKWSDTFCLGDHFEFAVQEKPYYLNYSWTSGGNYVDSVAANSPTCQITFLKSGYTVIQAHVFSKCAENKSSIDSIYVLDTAFQDFSLMIDGREIEASPDSGYALWYKWDFGNGHSSDEKSPLYLYDSGGTYLVSLVLGSHCAIDTLTQEIYIQGAGVKRIQNERAYIFPNPVVRTQALQISNNSFDHYEIWTTAGIVLVRDEIKSESIDLNTIQAGTYFIVLMNGDIRVIQRLIIL